jgi:F0F1-type ATP synthase assembly protein I
MPAENHESDQVKNARASLQLAFTVMAQIGVLTMGVIVVALVGGLWLDRQFSTRPLFTVLLMLASFPVSLFVIYRVALNAVGKIKPAAGQTPPKKEERQSDDNSQA